MPTTVTGWILDRIPHYNDGDTTLLRWQNRDGNVHEADVEDVAEMFGSTIEEALAADEDVVEAVISGEFSAAWKDTWLLWSEYGWV